MYAVIKTGGKQYRVEEGQRLDVELLGRAAEAVGEIELTPVLLVDGDTVLAGPTALGTSTVTARVVGETKGPKITGFTYKPKTNNRRRWGHRQRYSTVEITGISMTGGARPGRSATKGTATATAKSPAKSASKSPAKAATKSPAKAAKSGDTTARTSAARKTTAKKTTAKKATAKKRTAKTSAAKTSAAKKSTAKKRTSEG